MSHNSPLQNQPIKFDEKKRISLFSVCDLKWKELLEKMFRFLILVVVIGSTIASPVRQPRDTDVAAAGNSIATTDEKPDLEGRFGGGYPMHGGHGGYGHGGYGHGYPSGYGHAGYGQGYPGGMLFIK